MGPLNPNRASKSIVIIPQPASATNNHHVSGNTATTASPSTKTAPEQTMSGWLSKRSKNLQKSWKRNWFVLRDDSDDGRAQLVYYKDDSEYKPKNIINTSDILAVVAMEPTHFAVFTDRKDYHLRADTVAECAQWVERLKRVVNRNNTNIAPPPPAAVAVPESAPVMTGSATAIDVDTNHPTTGNSGLSNSVPTSTTAAIPIIGNAGNSTFSSYMGSPGDSSLFGQSLPLGSKGSAFGHKRVVSPLGGDTTSSIMSPGSYPGSDYFLSPDEEIDLNNYTLSQPTVLTDKPGGDTKKNKKKRLSMLSVPRRSISSSSSGEASAAASALSPSVDTSAGATLARALERGFVHGFNKKHYKHWKSQLLVLTHSGLYVYKIKHAPSTSVNLSDVSSDVKTAAAVADARLLHAIPVEQLIDANEAPPSAQSKPRPFVFEVIAAASALLTERNVRLRFAAPSEDELVRWLVAIKLAIDQKSF